MYPPHSDGGYPLLCEEAVRGLRARGHEVLVLTGTTGRSGARRRVKESGVWRIFDYCPDNRANELRSGRLRDLIRWFRRERIEHRLLQDALDSFRPETIFVWATKGMSYSIPIALQRTGLPFLGYVCGYWLAHHNTEAATRRQFAYWAWARDRTALGRIRGSTKRILRAVLNKARLPVDFEPLVFDGLAYNARPIRESIEGLGASRRPLVQIVDSSALEAFARVRPTAFGPSHRLLFVGRFHPTKDPVTLVRALGLLQRRHFPEPVRLDLVGWSQDPGYASALNDEIRRLPDPSAARLLDPVPFGEMPEVLGRYHVLIVPSTVDPLPRVAVEAMAAGLVAIVSDKTGISELVVDGDDAMVFPAQDPAALTTVISQVLSDQALSGRLGRNGREKALSYFNTTRMVDELDRFLHEGAAMRHVGQAGSEGGGRP